MVNYTTETTKTPQEALKQANPPQSGRITTTQTGNKSYKQDKLQAQTLKRIHWIKEKKYKEGNIKLSDNNSIFYTHYFFIMQIDIHSSHFVAKRGGLFFSLSSSRSQRIPPTRLNLIHTAQSLPRTTKENGSESPKTSDRYLIKYYTQHSSNNYHIFKSS